MRRENLINLGLLVLAMGIIVYLSISSPDPVSMNQGYFSDDQGATFFLDTTGKITPFDREGKEAVHANVFTCDQNKTRFVGYLDRYTAEMKDKMEHPPEDKKALIALMRQASANGVEIATPGSDQWVNRNSAEARTIMDGVQCPSGSQNNLTIVNP